MFPARAGMNRTNSIPGLWGMHVPRTRGDEPRLRTALLGVMACSPHARG